MKKYCIIPLLVSLFLLPCFVVAQEKILPFFDSKGAVRIETAEMESSGDTITTLTHRGDDIVWSRIVYRVIDMREKQNFQLYFPVRPNEDSRSLFRVMVDAITKGCDVYKRNARELKPSYTDSAKLTKEELSKAFAYNEDNANNIIQYDAAKKKYSVSVDQYGNYVKNQLKFLIQEVIFFDKNTSRMYTKIIGIAPMYALHPDNTEVKESMRYFQGSIICWFAFDKLRPYLSKQYVIPNGNETHRLTFDEFFAQKLYSSYLLGESNLFGRMLLDNEKLINDPVKFEKLVKKEQSRIETELMNIEQDLWEY